MSMMENKLLILCLIAHVLGDFYLQTNHIALWKEHNMKGLVFHGLLYCVPFLFILVLISNPFDLGISFFLLCLMHLIFDGLKYMFLKLWKNRRTPGNHLDGYLYTLDQGLHIISILVICYLFRKHDVNLVTWLQPIFGYYDLESILIGKWFLLILCIYKPVNITFAKWFSVYKPIVVEEETVRPLRLQASALNSQVFRTDDKKAGAVIGFLERILTVIFLSIGEFSAIGLVLTAKSIARYDMISKNKEFAEYYLIGTLTSVLFAMLAYYVIM